jgi:phage gp36-like protein
MNPYCSIAQIQALYDARAVVELSSDDGSEAQVDDTVQLCLDVAASDLESVLANRYPLPLPTVPLVLTGKVAALAMKKLYGRRSDIPKGTAADIQSAEDWMQLLIAGRVSIPFIDRQGPTLSYSGAKDGSSRFDRLPLQDQSGCGTDSVSGGRPGKLSAW